MNIRVMQFRCEKFCNYLQIKSNLSFLYKFYFRFICCCLWIKIISWLEKKNNNKRYIMNLCKFYYPYNLFAVKNFFNIDRLKKSVVQIIDEQEQFINQIRETVCWLPLGGEQVTFILMPQSQQPITVSVTARAMPHHTWLTSAPLPSDPASRFWIGSRLNR